MRLVLFGMEGAFSRAPLEVILAAGLDVRAVVVPRPPGMDRRAPARWFVPPHRAASDIPLLSTPFEPNIVQMAWSAQIPVLEVGRLDRTACDLLAALAPDLICVACFPRLLPPALLALPRLGALNLHPSLLPAYRGPAPLFWIFHDGLEHAGVTVHRMDAGADTGEIVAQAPVPLSDGITYSEAERVLSQAAGDLLIEALREIASRGLASRPQPEGAFPLAPFPTGADYVVTPEWDARRAFNFLRGLSGEGDPLSVQCAERAWPVRTALAYEAQVALDEPYVRHGDILTVHCAGGTLTVQL